jgi:hypothetical protein
MVCVCGGGGYRDAYDQTHPELLWIEIKLWLNEKYDSNKSLKPHIKFVLNSQRSRILYNFPNACVQQNSIC